MANIIIHEYQSDGFFSGEQFCYLCEKKMTREEVFKRTVKKGDRDYLRYCRFTSRYLFVTFSVYDYHWCCKPCNLELDCKEQYRIADIQKRLKRKRLTSDEVGVVSLPELPEPIPQLTSQEKRRQTFAIAAAIAVVVLAFVAITADILMN